MRKKKKVNKKKFLSRIFLLFAIIILIIIVVKNIGKKDVTKFSQTVIVNNQNITENLSYEPYINKDNVLYLSMEDIEKIFDENIYYEEESKKIITTSGTKVAAIDVNNNTAEINSANIVLPAGVLDYGDNLFLPISNLTNIYNIEVFTTENSAIISSLYDEFITVKTTAKVSLKEKTSGFSHTVKKLQEGTELIYLSDTEKKGWTKVLTYERRIWIYKK